MRPAELRIQLRAALSECRKYRGDSQEHLKACYEEVMEEPESDWPWWLDYFQTQARAAKVTYRKTSDVVSIIPSTLEYP